MEPNTIKTVVTSKGYTLNIGDTLGSIYSEAKPHGSVTSALRGSASQKITEFKKVSDGTVHAFADGEALGELYNCQAILY